MKFSSHSRAGFTLIEMLVVIAIIALLASIITVAASSAINAAKRAKAANMATQIQTAIVNYYTEYGVYPVPSGTTGDMAFTGTNEAGLMTALCGNINASTGTTQAGNVANTRQIVFLSPKKSEVNGSGIPINPFTTLSAPAYYSIDMDSDYSGVLGDSSPASPGPPDFSSATAGSSCPPGGKPITQGVAVWADCDPVSLPPLNGPSTSPQFWVHTY